MRTMTASDLVLAAFYIYATKSWDRDALVQLGGSAFARLKGWTDALRAELTRAHVYVLVVLAKSARSLTQAFALINIV